MKLRILLCPLLSLAPLSAQSWELGVFAGSQTYHTLSDSMPGLTTQGSADRKTTLAVRLGYSALDFGPVMLQVNASYQPTVTTRARIIYQSSSGPGQPPAEAIPRDYRDSHTSLGIMVISKTLVAVGAGVEMRFEKQFLGSSRASHARPWARANVAMAFPTPVLKPFIGLEIARALAYTNDGLQSAESLAPKSQIGAYAGVRF